MEEFFMKSNNPKELGYVVITDYVEANTGKDVSDEIQKVINENPMKTIYFPDGEYILAKPIATSGKPATSVCLHLSNFAILKASDDWSDEEAMVRLGAAEPYNTIYENGSNCYFYGGIVDGNMIAKGIAIESGRETSVRNVSIKHTTIGLHVKRGANNGSSDADIETVNIVGNNMKDSIGVLVEGYDNTFTNMRIAAVQTGIMSKSGGNYYRNIHPLYIYGGEYRKETDINFEDSVAFHDFNSTNWYDYCYSDQLATGFRFSADGARPILINCFAMWYSPRGNKEVAIQCDGRFCASVNNIRVHFRGDTTNNALLIEGAEGGTGFFESPVIDENLIQDKTYTKYIKGKVVW